MLLALMSAMLFGCEKTKEQNIQGQTVTIQDQRIDSKDVESYTIEITKDSIRPPVISVKEGSIVNLLFMNTAGQVKFSIDGYDIDEVFESVENQLTFEAIKKGNFIIYVDGFERGSLEVN